VLARLLDGTTRGARWAVVVAVATAVGVLVGASAVTGHPTRFVTVADRSSTASLTGSEHAAAGRSHADGKADKAAEKADKVDEQADKPDHKPATAEDKAGDAGTHGSCVSAVARDKDKVGGPHDNHGFAVSRAAHTCPNLEPGSTPGG
jgi:hypothetical protein